MAKGGGVEYICVFGKGYTDNSHFKCHTRQCPVLCEQSEAAVQLGQQHGNHPWERKCMSSAHNAGQADPILISLPMWSR